MNIYTPTVSSAPEIDRWKYPIGGVGIEKNFIPNRKFGVALIIGGIFMGILGVAILATPGLNAGAVAIGVAFLALSIFLACYGTYVYRENGQKIEETDLWGYIPSSDEAGYRNYLAKEGLLGGHLFSAAQSQNRQKLVFLFEELRCKSDEELEEVRKSFKEEVWDEGHQQDFTCRWVNHILKHKKGAIRLRSTAEFTHFFQQIGCP